MKNPLAIAFALFCVYALFAPIGIAGITALTGSQPSGPAAERPQLAALIASGVEEREQFADAVFDQNPLRRAVLRVKYAVEYRLGAVDTGQVVSGSPGWLFYTDQFEAWSCPQERRMRRGADRLEFIAELVEAANLPLLIAIAPNKATIERSHVAGRAAIYADCYDRIEQVLRVAARRSPSSVVVDHAVALEAWSGPGPAFYATDTHWTPAAAATGIEQLLNATDRLSGPNPLFEAEGESALATDLGRMLLQDLSETTPSMRLAAPQSGTLTGRAVAIHDSFYGAVEDLLLAAIPGLTMVHANSSDADIRSAVRTADLLIFQRAERFIQSAALEPTGLGWAGPVADWVLSQSANQARNCAWDRATDFLADGAALHLGEARRIDRENFVATGPNPQIYLRIPDAYALGSLCLRVEVEGRGTTQLFLRHSSFEFPGDGVRFTEGRSVTWRLDQTGPTRLVLVLPEDTGDVIRIDPVDGAGDFKLRSLQLAPRDS